MTFKIIPLGDLAVRISFGDSIEEETNGRIRQFILKLEKERVPGVIEWVPAYTSVTVYYEPEQISYEALKRKLEKVNLSLRETQLASPVVYEIPACYGGEFGLDLPFVAEYHGLSEQEVINLHAGREYLIYMMGFMPGFPYLGGMPDEIAVPRLEQPRFSVFPGSIGIGGSQTGIYPADAPSGWRIIGATPIRLYDPEKNEPFLLSAGNYIKFVPINQEEFFTIKEMRISYQLKTYAKE
ncbi:5-oxoprolinase subunit PxpB [Bacillus sp. JJ1609]|uniref:5-oxoprolinase subunit PxpB n=1 Tax=Bacillus sp. JJ1609 TaxID=3122977 RepID=UPI002FFE146F